MQEKGSLLLRTGMSNAKANNTYVLISRYIKVQHHTLWYYAGKESGYVRLYIKRVELGVLHEKALFRYW